MKSLKLLLLTFLGSSFLFSCVSNKKYLEAQNDIARLTKRNVDITGDLADVKSRLGLMEEANQDAANRLSQRDSALLANSRQLQEQQYKLMGQQERLLELQRIIDLQNQKTEALRQKMAEALGNFKAEDLSVFKKDGKVYVRMSENLLFPSGSAEVNKNGRDALRTLANALNQNKDININVEGHTDTVPIKIRFPDNWALSSARAISIVRILVNDYKVAPERFTASGRSQYEPVADNMTEDGRAQNRRTEIILAPKLNELMNLLNTEEGK